MKHVLAKVDQSHYAVLKKSRLKFKISIWTCRKMQHIKPFITEKDGNVYKYIYIFLFFRKGIL